MRSGPVLGRCMPFFPSNITNEDSIFDIDDFDSGAQTNVTFGVRKKVIWRQSYIIILVLKKTNLVVNFLVVHYLNSDCNYLVERSKLRQHTVNKFKTFLRLNFCYKIGSGVNFTKLSFAKNKVAGA
jgi:hypothetical protein